MVDHGLATSSRWILDHLKHLYMGRIMNMSISGFRVPDQESRAWDETCQRWPCEWRRMHPWIPGRRMGTSYIEMEVEIEKSMFDYWGMGMLVGGNMF